MLFDSTTPDMKGFDPSKSGGFTLPPVGIYANMQIQVVASEQGQTKNGLGKFDITYEVMDGDIKGSQFKLTYNTGHSNSDTAKWAVQDVFRIIYAITGDANIGRVNFDEKLYFKPFVGNLEVTNQTATDDSGNPFRNGKLKGLKPLAGQPQQAQQPVGQPQQQQYAQPQQGQQPAGRPQQAAPSWHNNG